jgi:hypothetical protein
MNEIVVVIDQKSSRARSTVPIQRLLESLDSDRRLDIRWERTMGDELQALLERPRVLPFVIEAGIRHDAWIGIGIGEIEERGRNVLESTGTAFLHARQAVEDAKKVPWGCTAAGVTDWCSILDQSLALYGTLLRQRTLEGWEVVDLRDNRHSAIEVAASLAVTPQAVTKRLRAAQYRAALKGRDLIAALASLAVLEPKLPSVDRPTR